MNGPHQPFRPLPYNGNNLAPGDLAYPRTRQSGSDGRVNALENYEMRIIAGSHRGRKLRLPADPKVRPMADRVRAALFSILGDAVPERDFVDVFAGSGAVGLEALSRGARQVTFVERDTRRVLALHQVLRDWRLADRAQVIQADAYRWAQQGSLPGEPCNVFLGPPYADLSAQPDAMRGMVHLLMARMPAGSVLIVQTDKYTPTDLLFGDPAWDLRLYGRTRIGFWVKEYPRHADGPVVDAADVPQEHVR